MGNLKYGQYTEEQANAEAAELGTDGTAWFKPKVGRNLIRVVPPPEGSNTPFLRVAQHWIDEVQQSVTCARLTAKQPCEVCAYVDKLRKSRLAEDQKKANDMSARRRIFCNVIDRSDEEAGVKVYGFGKTVYELLTGLRSDPDAGADFIDPIDGFDVILNRTGTKKNDTKYTVKLARKSTPLSLDGDEDTMQQWIDEQHDLTKHAKLTSVEEIRRMLAGEAAEDEEETPPKRRLAGGSKSTAKRRHDDDDDEDLDEHSGDDDDDDEDEAPAPKKKKKVVAASSDDDTSVRRKKKKKRRVDDDIEDAEIEEVDD